MMFKTVLFGGFLFATVCANAGSKPKMATLEVLPNFDYGLTHKDFRVHYSGAGDDFGNSPVSIKIYKKDQYEAAFHTFDVDQTQVNIPKAYYFGLKEATVGDYVVDVCVDETNCSGKNPALTSIEANHQKDKITCEIGTGANEYTKTKDISFDILGAEKWIKKTDLQSIEGPLSVDDTYQTEWTKNINSVKSNPSYDRKEHRFYAAVFFDIGNYRQLFMKKDAPGRTTETYAPDFCKRKYLLSYHVHIMEKSTHEVIHRFKKTLHMSQGGKLYFIYQNTASEKKDRRKVHVELTETGDLKLNSTNGYEVWVSFCATEKDKNESTACSDPVIEDLVISD